MKTFVGFLLVFCINVASAQVVDKSIVGTYSGTFTGVDGRAVGTTLVIKSVDDDGNFAGTVAVMLIRCGGTFPLKGKIVGTDVTATSAPGGATGDCNARRFVLKRSDKTLAGDFISEGGNVLKISLSK